MFECHKREDINCDEQWMRDCVADQKELKSGGYLPRLAKGHTSDNPSDPEKTADAYLDNYRFDPADRWLYADYVDVPKDLMEEIKANKWPGRSAEASRQKPRIEVVALLGATPSYFKLPDIRYSDTPDKHFIFSEITMATPTKSTLRQIYEDLAAMSVGAPGNPANQGAEAAPEDAQFKKFCELFQRLLKQAMGAGDAQPQYASDDDRIKAEEGKKKKDADYAAECATKDAAMKMAASAQGDTAIKYAAEQEKRNKDLVDRLDKLEADKVELEENLERKDWTLKYRAQPIPRGRMSEDDIKENVELIMGVASDKRQLYFDRSLKNVVAPSTTPVKQEADAGPVEAGSERESTEIRKLYEANRDRFRGDYGAAQREYRASKPVRY